MNQDVLDLIDDDSIQPVLDLSPQPVETIAVSPTESQQETPMPTAFNIPSLFNDDDDTLDTSDTQLPEDDLPIAARRLSADLLDDSDDELRELYKATRRRPRPSSKQPSTPAAQSSSTPHHAPPVPLASSSSGIPSSSTAAAKSSASVAKASRPVTAAPSAAQFVGEEDTGPISVDPALLEDDRDNYISTPSLYQGNEKPAAEQVDSAQIRQLLELNEKSSDATSEMDTPVEMKSLLMKHQRQALFWMVNRESEDNPPGHPRGGILADDQGFGKTVSMIALLLTNRPEPNGETTPRWGNLIVTPTSVLNQWAAELKEHIAPQFRPRVLIYHGPGKPKNAATLTMYDVVLTTYGTLAQEYPKVLEKDRGLVLSRRKPGNLYKINWFRVVLDEAQAIRNFRRETFKAANALKARRRWSLSGTPIQNTVNDIYSQFLFLGYHVTANYKEWEVRFKKPMEGKYSRPAHFERFQAILGVVLLRRAKYDKIDNKPVIDLPPRNMTTLDLTFTKTEEQFYHSQEERAVTRMHREVGTTGNDFALALHIILRLRQACGHPDLCLWNSGEHFTFSDDELDVVELRMKTKCMFYKLPEQVRNRLYNELGPEKEVPQTCPICMDLIESGVVTKCGHLFCVSDYESWRANNDTCPTCRGNLTGDDDVMSLEGVRKEIHAIARKKKREEAEKKAENQFHITDPKGEPSFSGSHSGKAEPIALDPVAKAEPITLGSLSKVEPICLEAASSTMVKEENEFGKRRASSPSAGPSAKRRRDTDDIAEDDSSDDESSTSNPSDGDGEGERGAAQLKTSTKIKRFMMEYENILEKTDDKVLCFSQWTRMLDLVERVVKESGYEYVRLDGTMSTTQRDEQVRLFKTRSKCRLFLISLTAGSTGLNLTVANRVFLLDSWWNPAVESQVRCACNASSLTRVRSSSGNCI